MEPATIAVKGARVHNLKNVSLSLPRNKLICLTGVSGSGKSSFAFDTLYAEGQRRYIESLSSYARQFLVQLAKPDVDLITGLSPSISIQQKAGGWNPRSTVGTITQIHDYLRVLYARVGRQHCTECGQPISAQSREQIVAQILAWGSGFRILILAPAVREQKGEFRDLFEDMLKQGFARARVDGVVRSLSDDPNLDKNIKHNIEIVIDRLALNGDSIRSRLAEAVDQALALGKGTLIVARAERDGTVQLTRARKSKIRNQSAIRNSQSAIDGDLLLSSHYACTHCNLSFEPPSPQMFSFNAPTGMCLTCDGLGTQYDFDPNLLIPEPRKSLLSGCIAAWPHRVGRWKRHILEGVARHLGIDLKSSWNKLPEGARQALLYGTGDAHIGFEWRTRGGVWRHGGAFDGIVTELRDKHRKSASTIVRSWYEKFMRQRVCPDCGGARLNRQALAVRITGPVGGNSLGGGRLARQTGGHDAGPPALNIHEACTLSIADAAAFFAGARFNDTERTIARDVLKEVGARLEFLMNVGLHYLTLDRTAPTLSGGESQRIRLASQIGSGLVGVLYILDEPSIGLHARDNRKLVDSLLKLRDMGNTVIVVEHDEETMRTADHIVDFGPGPGVRGGEVVAEGDIDRIARTKDSCTAQYLTGQRQIEIPTQRRPVTRDGVLKSRRRRAR
ncbi:MAG TPA: excinuclease ABC subunit UvrA [Phycisphaerae bacterium]|jgi:excinuclease ABC subunit A